MMLDQGKQSLGIGAGQEHPGIDPQLFTLLDSAVILKQVIQTLQAVHLEKHRPGDVEAQFLFIPADPLGSPGAAVIPQVHPEPYQMLGLNVVGGVLHQSIVRTVLVLQHGVDRLEKTTQKAAL